jgi:hypothetical protein
MSTTDLAALGGEPEFDEPLHVGRPNVGDSERFIARVRDILQSGWLTNDGQYVREFEERIAELSGTRHCVAMSNGTVALEIASRALGLVDEVIIPAFTFVATAHALMWQGIRPVFCDIDPATHQIVQVQAIGVTVKNDKFPPAKYMLGKFKVYPADKIMATVYRRVAGSLQGIGPSTRRAHPWHPPSPIG